MTERGRFTLGLAASTVVPIVLAPILAPANGTGISELFGILVVVAYAGHIAVTGWLWTKADARRTARGHPWRTFGFPTLLVVLAAGLALYLPDRTLGLLLMGFFAWQFHHFRRQNLGLVTRVATSWSADPIGKTEVRLLAVATCCGIVGLLARPSRLGLPVDISQAGMIATISALAYAACVAAAVIAALDRRRPTPVTATYLMSVLFMAPVFLFHSTQGAITGMVVAHGLQYLWAARWRSRRRRHEVGRAGWQTTLAIVAVAVVGGSILESMSELQSTRSGMFRLLYGVYLGVVMSHFAVDGLLWRRPTPVAVTSRGGWALLPSPAHGRL